MKDFAAVADIRFDTQSISLLGVSVTIFGELRFTEESGYKWQHFFSLLFELCLSDRGRTVAKCDDG